MAVRKTGSRKTTTRKTTKKPPLKSASKGKRNRAPTSAAFWVFLIIVIIIAFFMLLPVIKRGLTVTPKTTEIEQQQEQTEITAQPNPPPPKPSEQKPAVSEQTPQPKPPVKEPEKAPNAKPQDQPEKKPQTEKPATSIPVTTPPVKPVETRDRSIYLIQESTKMLVKVNRNVNATLTDSINALLAGPTPDEIMRGIGSFVPEGSRLLKAEVKGSTARLSFNQEFRYNQRGREGCDAQIKQIVWTATEFPNVQDVQFLIDGEEVDFLSEGVVIRNPISR